MAPTQFLIIFPELDANFIPHAGILADNFFVRGKSCPPPTAPRLREMNIDYRNEQETRGRKGSGFHMNLFVVAIMVLISSFLGLPWMCLAAVETSVHLDSLKVWSSFDAPGVKSRVVKIREQRLTLFFTGVLIGE